MDQDSESAGIEKRHVAEINHHLGRLLNLAELGREKVSRCNIQLALHPEDDAALSFAGHNGDQSLRHGMVHSDFELMAESKYAGARRS